MKKKVRPLTIDERIEAQRTAQAWLDGKIETIDTTSLMFCRLMATLRESYRDGIRAAADFAGQWESQIVNTQYLFEDIILYKFNLIRQNKMRRKRKTK